ncbi:hypothetical protein JDV02_006185 [Purpureocillium takamizusanense]|uniref:Uncharacterized protein n=1 Tax=Purpureocillium takamizusanense TaxID=2060973 RepID=A0A9Q8VBV6_9HYPO|nr:uncharacterized protein JDV02_006185 [Purpureocillium takamizusanense]UNI20058.1 hypothetical protein JDV02_006185 [Purpureocillium takamizusanense]
MAAGEKKWDAAAERDLCVAIIMGNQEGRTNYNWPKVHAFLTKLGYKFTKDAISQHFTKVVMKDFKVRHGEDPVKSGPSTPNKKSATPRRATPAAGTAAASGTPSKRKTPPTKAAAAKSVELASPGNDEKSSDSEPLAKKQKKQKVLKAEAVEEEAAEASPATKKETSRAARARSQTLAPGFDAFEAWLKSTGS